jgi:hypothetical protein
VGSNRVVLVSNDGCSRKRILPPSHNIRDFFLHCLTIRLIKKIVQI